MADDFTTGLAKSFGCVPDWAIATLGISGLYLAMGGKGLIFPKTDPTYGMLALSMATFAIFYRYVVKGDCTGEWSG